MARNSKTEPFNYVEFFLHASLAGLVEFALNQLLEHLKDGLPAFLGKILDLPVSLAVLFWLALYAMIYFLITLVIKMFKHQTQPSTETDSKTNAPSLPLKTLQKFSFDPSDTPLSTCWKTEDGEPQRTTVKTGLYGDVLKFSGKGSSDCEIVNVVPRKGKSVTIICQPEFNFVFYLLFKVSSANGADYKTIWIALRTDITAVKKQIWDTGGYEWNYPVMPVHLESNWVRITVNLEEIEKQTVAKDDYKLFQLTRFKIRGNGLLESITISELNGI